MVLRYTDYVQKFASSKQVADAAAPNADGDDDKDGDSDEDEHEISDAGSYDEDAADGMDV